MPLKDQLPEIPENGNPDLALAETFPSNGNIEKAYLVTTIADSLAVSGEVTSTTSPETLRNSLTMDSHHRLIQIDKNSFLSVCFS